MSKTDKNIKTSPIFYAGNKKKLIGKGLIELFPKNIETFYDLFCGSGTVTLNTVANNYILNDCNVNICELLSLFSKSNPENIIKDIQLKIEQYGLPTFSTDTRKYNGDREIFKKRYNKLRDDYNKTRMVLLLYCLNLFSNSHMIRFNSDGNFNMPFGNGYFTEETIKNIYNCNFSSLNSSITNKDFYEYINEKFKINDFVYLDPPYLNTVATYNESGGWSKDDEKRLCVFCETLNTNKIKFALSNTYENTELLRWADLQGFNIHVFDGQIHCATGLGNSKRTEILITNY